MEAIIDKLARKIDDEKNEKQRKKKSYWEQINDEIQKLNDEFSEKKFTYLLNKPSPRKKYEITFRSHNKEDGSEYISFQDLSSGEKMIFELICYYFVSCKDENSKDVVKLIILDEFDANLNPALAELYLKTVNKEFVENGIKVILTTHSPSTIAEVNPENLCELINDNKDGHKIEWANNEDGKKKILEKLAPKFVYDNDLGPLGAIKGSRDIIIFVEGENDENYFTKIAEEKNLDKKYKFIECGSADNIPFILKSFTIIPYFKKILDSKKIIAIFDFDKKGIKKIEDFNSRSSEIHNLRNSEEPIVIKKDGVFLMALVPPPNHDSWKYYEKNEYRLEELKKEDQANNGRAVNRLFAEIKKIVNNQGS